MMEKIRLGDLVEFQRGYDLPKNEFKNGKIPVISSNGILGYHNEVKIKEIGITIGRSGTVGFPHLIKQDFFPHNTTLFIKNFNGNNVVYIYYLLKSLNLNEYKSGSGVPTINRNHLHPLKVTATKNKETQQKIAKILSDIDDKIEILHQINDNLAELAKTIYDYWFVQFDFPDENGKPYKTSGGKMVYNDILKREIPEGWEVKKLGEVIEPLESGKRPKGGIDKTLKEGIPSLGAECIDELGIFNFSSTRYIPYSFQNKITSGVIKNNDILIYKDGAYVGKTTIFKDNFPFDYATINEHIFLMRAKNVLSQNFLLSTLKQKNYFDIMQSLGQKAAQPGLNQEDLKSIKILVPNQKNITDFYTYSEKLLISIFKNANQSKELQSLRDWLLPMLMNGQISVK